LPRQPEPPPEEEDGAEGTSRVAQAVSVGMEHLNTPRTAGSFDPSKASPSTLIPLQSISIATPCRADWSKMEGDDKSRFCQTCQKSVYNLSAMTTPEAQALIAEKDGSLCARIYRRADGTVITSDCLVGKTAPRRAFWGASLAAIFGALLSGCSSNASRLPGSSSFDSIRHVPVLGVLVNLLSPQPTLTAGAIAIVVPNSTKAPCPVPTAALSGTPMQEPGVLMGAVALAPPVMGKIAPPRPSATPKPTTAPTHAPGEPEMGEATSIGS
jgi:hypothetical protein